MTEDTRQTGAAQRFRDYALQLKNETRVVIRNIHAPSGGNLAQEREDLLRRCGEELTGDLHLTIGDFNQPIRDREGSIAIIPNGRTFRQSADKQWVSAIDGALASPLLASGATSGFPKYPGDAQHHPVLLSFNTSPLTNDFLTWRRLPPKEPRWSLELIEEFHSAVQSNINLAWAIWHFGSGGQLDQSTWSFQPPWGGWTTGQDGRAINTHWKKYRCEAAKMSHEGDVAARKALENIAALIEANAQSRLGKWKEKVTTHGGASRWIKTKLETPPPLASDAGSAHLAPEAKAEAVATSLAARWNAGVSKADTTWRGSLSSLSGSARLPRRSLVAAPPPRSSPATVASVCNLGNLVPAPPPPLPEWTWEAVVEAMPKGAPGLDGWTRQALLELDEPSRDALVHLLRAADDGRWPDFWSEARTLGIPKADSHERRPLTIMSSLYRIWAGRAASHYAEWADSWWPEGVHGARAGHSAADASWKIAMLIELARASGKPHCALTIDTEKCFDRYLLPALEELCRQAKMPDIVMSVLRNYANLSRHLYLDGYPTPFIIEGGHICGIPQGCPMAPFFCNMVAAAWEYSITIATGGDRHMHTFTYLDDRLFLSSSPALMEQALQVTIALDTVLGTKVNIGKSKWISFHGKFLARLRLRAFESVKNFTYLGTDFFNNTSKNAGYDAKPRAKSRVADFSRKAVLVAKLPASSRPACTADMTAALWLTGASLYAKKTYDDFTSVSARALRGSRPFGQTRNRSRLAEHIVSSPGVHRSCPLIAAVYDISRAIVRFRRKDAQAALWHDYWNQRRCAILGPIPALRWPLAALGITWTSATVLNFGHAVFDLASVPDTKPRADILWHQFRDMLRRSAWTIEALRRPKDFDGAQAGEAKCTKFLVGESCGPALHSAGQWTRMRMYIAGLVDDATCVRCNSAPETLEHRLWHCPADAVRRRALISAVADERRHLIPLRLPNCLRRCGVVPANSPWTAQEATMIRLYLLNTAQLASVALADTKLAGRQA